MPALVVAHNNAYANSLNAYDNAQPSIKSTSKGAGSVRKGNSDAEFNKFMHAAGQPEESIIAATNTDRGSDMDMGQRQNASGSLECFDVAPEVNGKPDDDAVGGPHMPIARRLRS